MFSGSEWIWIVIIALVLFGGSQIPKLARNLGQAQNEFKKGLTNPEDESEGDPTDPDSKDPDSKDASSKDTGSKQSTKE